LYMIDERFMVLASALLVVGIAGYAFDTFKGKTQPNRVTWFLWSLAPLIAFAAQVREGVGWQALMSFFVGFGPLIVVIASLLNKKAYWKISKLDIFCGTLSVSALALWYITGSGNVAILFSIIADVFAAFPTVLKAYKEPESETYLVFFLATLSAIITLLTIRNWSFANSAFAVYILLINALLFGIIFIKQKAYLDLKKINLE
jgi:hypothetical protein